MKRGTKSFIYFIILCFLIKIFCSLVAAIGWPLDKFIIFAAGLYLLLIAIIILTFIEIIEIISSFFLPKVQKLIKYWKDKSKKPEIIEVKKIKKKKFKKTVEVQGYSAITEKKGQIFNRLGIEYGKIKKPEEKKVIDLETEEKEIKRRNLDVYVKQLKKDGFIKVSENDHLGKIRGYDILLYLKRELRRQGIRTKLLNNRSKLRLVDYK